MAILRTGQDGKAGLLFIYAPGAGSDINDAFSAHLATDLAEDGVECWRFEFPYMEAQRRAPDRPAVLEAAWRTVIEQAKRETGKRVVAGGRSMGGRIASQAVAQGTGVDGLVLFAYPSIRAAGRTSIAPSIWPSFLCPRSSAPARVTPSAHRKS